MADKAPVVQPTVKDLSVLKGGGNVGAVMILAYTQKGEVATPVLVRSFIDFTRKRGELVDKSISTGSLEIKRALDGGAPVYVSRIGHYTDPTDDSTLTGDKAVAAVGGAAVTAYAIGAANVAPTNTFVHTGVDVLLKFPPGSTFTVTGSTGNDGTYTVKSVVFSTNTTIETVEDIADATADGDMNASDNVTSYESKHIGPGYNGNVVSHLAPASGTANVFDIAIDVPLHDELREVFRDFPETPGAQDILDFNAFSKEANMLVVEGVIDLGNSTFAQGAQVYGDIVDADWIGDLNEQTGIFAFIVVDDGIAIAIPEKTENAIDLSISSYAALNWIRGYIKSPVGLSSSAAKDYRKAEGVYTAGTAIDDHRTTMWAGGVKLNNADTNFEVFDIGGIGDALAKKSQVYQEGRPWFSPSGVQPTDFRGVIADSIGVAFNHGNPTLIDDWTALTQAGVATIVPKKVLGVTRATLWGDSTLQLAATLLQSENVSELVLYFRRRALDILEGGMFDPLDTDLWKSLYNRMRSEVFAELVAGRALRGGEGVGWTWQGDQFVEDIADAQLNTAETLDKGEYYCEAFLKPIRATNFIGFGINIVGTDVDITVLPTT